MTRPRFWFLIALSVAAAASRVLPHPYNFSPMTAVALFGGVTFAGLAPAVLVPLGSFLLGDLFLELAYRSGYQPNWGFHRGQWVIYACVLATIGLGRLIRSRRNAATVAAGTLAASVFFFLATNFAVWAGGSGATYPKTPAGLLLCYEMGLPFFRNALAGDAFFATLLFGGLALAEARFPSLRSSSPAVA